MVALSQRPGEPAENVFALTKDCTGSRNPTVLVAASGSLRMQTDIGSIFSWSRRAKGDYFPDQPQKRLPRIARLTDACDYDLAIKLTKSIDFIKLTAVTGGRFTSFLSW